MCGEHLILLSPFVFFMGSSPHVRGTLHPHGVVGAMARIIPACAGNTSRTLSVSLSIWDHPRMCGEHLAAYAGEIEEVGSSPHVRGTLSPQRGQ